MREDEEGWFYFVDRFKDCLRRRGENISSYQVEQPILDHPAVASCAAIGVPADEEAGEEEIAVFVLPAQGAQVSPEEISAWVAERLPAFLRPRYFQIVESLPMTPSGKVQKAQLRKLVLAALEEVELDDTLPAAMRKSYDLAELAPSVRSLHLPAPGPATAMPSTSTSVRKRFPPR